MYYALLLSNKGIQLTIALDQLPWYLPYHMKIACSVPVANIYCLCNTIDTGGLVQLTVKQVFFITCKCIVCGSFTVAYTYIVHVPSCQTINNQSYGDWRLIVSWREETERIMLSVHFSPTLHPRDYLHHFVLHILVRGHIHVVRLFLH